MSRKVIKHVLIRNEKLNIENYEKNSLDISNNKGETYMSSQIQAKERTNSINFINIDNLQTNSPINDEEKVVKALDSANYFHFLKSYLCFKDQKTRLINECYELHKEEVCIENILKRLYEYEERIDCIETILNENSLVAKNIPKSERFEKIYELVNEIEKKNNEKPKK